MNKEFIEITRLRTTIKLAANALTETPQAEQIDVVWYSEHETLWDFLTDAINYDSDIVPLPIDDDPVHAWKQKADKFQARVSELEECVSLRIRYCEVATGLVEARHREGYTPDELAKTLIGAYRTLKRPMVEIMEAQMKGATK